MMLSGKPGRDVSSVVREVLAGEEYEEQVYGAFPRSRIRPSRLTDRLSDIRPAMLGVPPGENAYQRMLNTLTGRRALERIGNEEQALEAFSTLSLEVLFFYLEERTGLRADTPATESRVLAVPGKPWEPPVLVVLTPNLDDVSQSRRLTDELELDPVGLVDAYQRLRPQVEYGFDTRVRMLASDADPEMALDLLWISQPEVVLTRRPRMVPLCAPSPHISVAGVGPVSSVGVLCRDADGELGVTACFHGTGPAGTRVNVAGVPSVVKHADQVQDIVFIPVGEPPSRYPTPCGTKGVRSQIAPSQGEPVTFEGAGSGAKINTRVSSHDAGILRKRHTVQLKVQTPADTNNGDSGAALIDGCDRVLGFGFERSGIGEFPEITDWIWANNALAALGLTPI